MDKMKNSFIFNFASRQGRHLCGLKRILAAMTSGILEPNRAGRMGPTLRPTGLDRSAFSVHANIEPHVFPRRERSHQAVERTLRNFVMRFVSSFKLRARPLFWSSASGRNKSGRLGASPVHGIDRHPGCSRPRRLLDELKRKGALSQNVARDNA
jgi:hypothetical protein